MSDNATYLVAAAAVAINKMRDRYNGKAIVVGIPTSTSSGGVICRLQLGAPMSASSYSGIEKNRTYIAVVVITAGKYRLSEIHREGGRSEEEELQGTERKCKGIHSED